MPKLAVKPSQWPISIIGPGAVGSALALALSEAGLRSIALIGKPKPGKQTLSKALKVRHGGSSSQTTQDQGVIIMTLREPQIAAAARELAALPLPWTRLSVLHTSGPLGAEVLKPLASLGAGVAAWHPYQTFPKGAKGVRLSGVTFGITGNPRGVRAARRLTRLLGGHPLKIAEEDRVLYHLSAVFACGFLAANLQMATEVLTAIGLPPDRALRTLLPIAEETLAQVAAAGPRKAMTGPAARGDTATIKKHLAALKRLDPALAKAYAATTGFVLRGR